MRSRRSCGRKGLEGGTNVLDCYLGDYGDDDWYKYRYHSYKKITKLLLNSMRRNSNLSFRSFWKQNGGWTWQLAKGNHPRFQSSSIWDPTAEIDDGSDVLLVVYSLVWRLTSLIVLLLKHRHRWGTTSWKRLAEGCSIDLINYSKLGLITKPRIFIRKFKKKASSFSQGWASLLLIFILFPQLYLVISTLETDWRSYRSCPLR